MRKDAQKVFMSFSFSLPHPPLPTFPGASSPLICNTIDGGNENKVNSEDIKGFVTDTYFLDCSDDLATKLHFLQRQILCKNRDKTKSILFFPSYISFLGLPLMYIHMYVFIHLPFR